MKKVSSNAGVKSESTSKNAKTIAAQASSSSGRNVDESGSWASSIIQYTKYNGLYAWEYFCSSSHAFISLSVWRWWSNTNNNNTSATAQRAECRMQLFYCLTLAPYYRAWRHHFSFTLKHVHTLFRVAAIGFNSNHIVMRCITSSHV